MNLALALPLGVASAIAYGVAAAVQHEAVGQTGSDEPPRPLSQLLRDGRWWASIGGDSLGLVLQLAALAFGPVVLVQPLFVLCLPIALPVRAMFGGARARRADYLVALVLALGLAGFFAIAGTPASTRPLSITATVVLAVVAMAIGGAIAVSARPAGDTAKAVTLSAVSGLWFGVEAVLVNVVAADFNRHSWSAFTAAPAWVAAVAATVVGMSGFALSQVAFRSGNLAASFPAMLVADPLIAVVLGAALLHESVRGGAAPIIGYLVCLAVIVLATLRLARPVNDASASRLT